MIWIILTIVCISLVLSYIKFKTWGNPYTVFNILWICITILLIKGDKFVYSPSKIAILCILIGIFGFNLSIFIPRIKFSKKKAKSLIKDRYYLNRKRAYFISIFILIFSLQDFIKTILLVLSGYSFSEIRNVYFAVSGFDSVLMYYFKEFVISPLRYVVIVSAIISLFCYKKKNIGLLINALLLIVFQAINSGGRYILMNSIFMFICGYFLFGDKKKIEKKKKYGLICIITIAFAIIIYLTNQRTTYLARNMTVLERLYNTIYQYFAGSVTYLGKIIEKNPWIEGSTYGINFIAGFSRILFVILTFLRILPYPQILNIIGMYACEELKIGPYTFYNAMPTIFGYFYIDGGLILVFIESLIFGYICKILYKFANKNNLFFSACYIIIFVQICNSSTRWFFYAIDYSLAFFYLRAVICPIKKRKY